MFNQEIKFLICRECGRQIIDVGLCSDACPLDTDDPSERDPAKLEWAVYGYLRTDPYVREASVQDFMQEMMAERDAAPSWELDSEEQKIVDKRKVEQLNTQRGHQ